MDGPPKHELQTHFVLNSWIMWNRIYLVSLAVFVATMTFFSYYSWTWLKSIGEPPAAVEGYLYHSGISWMFFWISSIALLIIANFVLGKYRRSWAMWVTFVYFAVFVIIRYVVLEQAFFQFKKSNGLWEGGFSLAPVAAVVFCTVAAVVVYANQFVGVRLRKRMFPDKVEATDTLEYSDTSREGEES